MARNPPGEVAKANCSVASFASLMKGSSQGRAWYPYEIRRMMDPVMLQIEGRPGAMRPKVEHSLSHMLCKVVRRVQQVLQKLENLALLDLVELVHRALSADDLLHEAPTRAMSRAVR